MGRHGGVSFHLAEVYTDTGLSRSRVPAKCFSFASAVVCGRIASKQKTSIIHCLKESSTPQFSR